MAYINAEYTVGRYHMTKQGYRVCFEQCMGFDSLEDAKAYAEECLSQPKAKREMQSCIIRRYPNHESDAGYDLMILSA